MALPPRSGKDRVFAKPLRDFVSRTLDPVAAKQGFSESDVILHWADVAGPRLAAVSEPIRLQWPPRAPNRAPDAPAEPAPLHVRVESAFALELQHAAPLVVERANARLGWRAIGRLALRQGPVGRDRPTRRQPLAIDPEAARAAGAAAEPIADENLRAAVARLGAAALSAGRAGRKG
ncbi:MAG: DUF721 domain-containing protein [Beijerinckiaceae bacterium]